MARSLRASFKPGSKIVLFWNHTIRPAKTSALPQQAHTITNMEINTAIKEERQVGCIKYELIRQHGATIVYLIQDKCNAFDVEERPKIETVEFVFQNQTCLRMGGLWVPKHLRGRGFATELVNQVCSIADASNYTIFLEAFPFSAEYVSEDKINRLKKFYSRFGFEEYGPYSMQRTKK